MSQKEIIGKFTLNYKYYSGQDYYSDGDIEEELLSICKSDKVQDAILHNSAWPIVYHLSPIRENILEWYPFRKKASLLEIGSGCGALTGLFTKKVDDVICIELSKRRSIINAYKNGKNGVAEIYVGNFKNIKINKKFDYVTLIGVLEYAKSYIASNNSYVDMINQTKNYLKDDGKLIIAIENKQGMKYWAGAAEDHTGSPYDGINNYVKGAGALTFSKPELEQMLRKCGFNDIKFYYPVPDYKLPTVIYSDDCLPDAGEIRGVKVAYAGDNYKMFDEEIAFDNVCKDGLFPYFANSFLVIAKR